jgi:hypothetical protein
MIFPLPEEHVRRCADDFVVRAASLVAALHSMDPVLGSYRVHGTNHWFSTDRRMSPEFIATLDSYLNRQLANAGIAATISYFNSMYCWWDLLKDKRYLRLVLQMIRICVLQRDKHTFGHAYRFVRDAIKSQSRYQQARNKLDSARMFSRRLRRRAYRYFSR